MNRKQRRAEIKQHGPVQQDAAQTVQALFTAAMEHHRAGRLNAVILCFRKAVAVAPGFAQAHSNLGAALKEAGQLAEAVICFRKAVELAPEFAQAHNNLGAAFKELGRLEEAVSFYRKAIQLAPGNAQTHNNLGAALMELGWMDEAVAHYRKAIELAPDYAAAYCNLGDALEEMGQLDEAVACCRKAIALAPDFAEAYNNLGVALAGQRNFEEAVLCYRKVIEFIPDHTEAYSNLGDALEQQGQGQEAVAYCRRAVELTPHIAKAHNNLGVALMRQAAWAEAADCFRRAIALNPELAESHTPLAMALLAQGDMVAGWEEYEWRWKTRYLRPVQRHFAQPQWRGEAGHGRTLLIHAEQGFGDTLQFCRYAPLAAARGLRVILEVQKPLVRLLKSLPGVDAVIAQGEELPPFDLHAPMLSLPLALGTTVESIPRSIAAYLHADEAAVAAWQTRLDTIAGQNPRIGLVWAGNPRNYSPLLAATDRRRSMAPEQLAPLLELSGFHFFSLQKDGPAAPEAWKLINLMAEMDDFADTAALIANLDLVITVDTAVAHLAAALAKPVWLMNRFDTCWRWLTDRKDSPWYPTLRLYRQPAPGDWASVIADITRDLRRFPR